MRLPSAVVCLALLAVLLAHQYYILPITSDAAELARQARYIISSNSLSVPSTSVNSGVINYPPFFAVLLAETSLLAGVNHFDALNLLSYVFVLALVFSTVLLCRRTGCKESEAWLAGVSTVFMPLLFYRTVTPIAETLGLFLFALTIYLFDSKKYAFSFALLLLLPFSHYRSFAVAAVAILLLGVFSSRIKAALSVTAIPVVVYFLVVPKEALGFWNPWVIAQTPLDVFGWLAIIAASVGFVYFVAFKREGFDAITTSLIMSFVVTSFITPFSFRQLAYLFPVAAKYSSKIAAVDFRVTASFLILGSLAVVQATAYRAPPFNQHEIAVFKSLDFFSGSTVAAPFSESNILPYYSEKKVVVGAFAESLPDGRERLGQLWNYYNGASFSERKAFEKKYGVDVVVGAASEGGFSSKLVDNGAAALYRP